MRWLIAVIEAWLFLWMYECLSIVGFRLVHKVTYAWPTLGLLPHLPVARVCDAADEATVWYVKRVYCLQRSAVTVWMLRNRGIPARLVIGYRPTPLESHAWVEVSDEVVNDRPGYKKFFTVLETL
jgi:hypothetical protein